MRDCHGEIAGFHEAKVRLPNSERTEMRKRRNANRDRLKKGLARDDSPKPIGCHTQGSYAMHTMVQDENSDYDIDDGVYFKADDLMGPRGGEMTPLQVREMVCQALQDDRFADAPEVRKNCVRVYYTAGYHVDVPAYRRITTKDHWSGQEKHTYELASSSWRSSDPRAVTKWFDQNNASLSAADDGEGQFRRVVRMLKLFARSRNSWKSQTASGFMITKLASEVFVPSKGRDDEALRLTMNAIENRLQWNKVVKHPVVDENLTKDNDPKPEFFRSKLAENLVHLGILDNHDCSHNEAMKAWDSVFNSSWFSEQPDPGAASDPSNFGTPTKAVEKVSGGRFASSD